MTTINKNIRGGYRRRMMMAMLGGNDMKSWTKIVDFSGPLNIDGAFECPCLDTEGMTEFRIRIQAGKDTGERYTGSARASVYLDGRSVGYFPLVKNFSQSGTSMIVNAETEPFPQITVADTNSNDIAFNKVTPFIHATFGAVSEHTKKFVIKFSNGYTTDNFSVQAYGR